MESRPDSLDILARAAGGPAPSGTEVAAAVDRAVLSGTLAPGVLLAVRETGAPWSADDLILTLDFHAPEVESRVPRARSRCRELAETWALKHVFDLNAGIGTLVTVEYGLVQPGQLVVGCGRCLGVVGAVGALGWRLDESELAVAVTTGRLEVRSPEVVRVDLKGRLPRHRGAWDLARAVAGALATGLGGRVLELTGDTKALSIDFRSALCGLLTEMGAAAALVRPDERVREHYERLGLEPVTHPPGEDTGDYADAVEVELEGILSIQAPGYREPATTLGEDGDPVQGAFVGSCYGGHYEDLAVVAEILKQAGSVHPGVRLTVSPSTLEVARACLKAGFYETFLGAGAMVTVPGAGAGRVGSGAILGEGERLASTSEYHRTLGPGQGAPDISVMSPAAAASAAVAGRLVDPAGYIS